MSTRIALVDYEMGNLRSVSSALQHLGADPLITNDAGEMAAADGVILPGVGAFADAAAALEARELSVPLRELARGASEERGRPFLGICLGLQLLFAESEEAPGVSGLDVIPGKVVRFPAKGPDGAMLKVPHMGWNSVRVSSENRLTRIVPPEEYFYFVHSYYALTDNPDDTALACEYGGVRFAAMAARGALFATQFHPEKSQGAGIELLRAFLEMCA